jgi:hypothetical protein
MPCASSTWQRCNINIAEHCTRQLPSGSLGLGNTGVQASSSMNTAADAAAPNSQEGVVGAKEHITHNPAMLQLKHAADNRHNLQRLSTSPTVNKCLASHALAAQAFAATSRLRKIPAMRSRSLRIPETSYATAVATAGNAHHFNASTTPLSTTACHAMR